MLATARGDPSSASTQQHWKELISPSTRDHQQSGHNYFVSHVGQAGARASEAGQGQGALPGFYSSEGTPQSVRWRRPAHSSQGTHTHNRGTCRYSVQLGTTDRFTQRPVICGRRWPVVGHKPIWALLTCTTQATNSRSLPDGKKLTFLREKSAGRRGQLLAP